MDEDLLLSFESLEREHWWFVVRRRLVLESIARTELPAEPRIAEVGCGTGGLLADLRERYPSAEISGVEPVAEAARIARRSRCEVAVAYFEQLPLATGSVDLLIALDVLEHCEDAAAALVEAHRVLRPGGRLVLTVPALPSLWGRHDEINGHKRRYVRNQLTASLEQAGMTPERVTYFNAILLPAGYAGRVISRLTSSSLGMGVSLPSRPVNAVMRGIFGMELPLLRRVDLPIGMSLLAEASKPLA